MIEAIAAVARADAVASAAVPHANARRTIEGRTRRLRWLDALRAANGEPIPIDDEERDEEILAEGRARIRAALETIEELGGFDGSDEADAPETETPVSATAVARLIAASRERALGAQAHIGAASIRSILAQEKW
jgi:hypothetical protein